MDYRSDLPRERTAADYGVTGGRVDRPPASLNGLRREAYEAAQHYQHIAAWWAVRGSACLPVNVLPPTGSVVIRGDDEAVAACLIWLTNAHAAYLAFPVSAPDLEPRLAYRAVGLAIEGALTVGRDAGCRMIWATTASRGIDRLYARAGLVRTSPQGNFFMLIGSSLSADMLTD